MLYQNISNHFCGVLWKTKYQGHQMYNHCFSWGFNRPFPAFMGIGDWNNKWSLMDGSAKQQKKCGPPLIQMPISLVIFFRCDFNPLQSCLTIKGHHLVTTKYCTCLKSTAVTTCVKYHSCEFDYYSLELNKMACPFIVIISKMGGTSENSIETSVNLIQTFI